MAAGILLYGVGLDDSDTAWASFFESHDCKLSAATEAVARRKLVNVSHPAFECAVVGRPWWWFVAIPESCLMAVGKDVTPVETISVDPDWDRRLRQFCELFDLGQKEPGWYVTYVEDAQHQGRQLVVS